MKCLAEYELISEAGFAPNATVLKIDHPTNLFTVSIRKSDATCQEDKCALRLWIEFEAEALSASKEISDKYLSDVMNVFSLTTSCSIRVVKISRIIDWTPELVERDALLFVHNNATDAPFDFLNHEIVNSMGELLHHCDDGHVQRAMRWFRSALDQEINDDVFHCFWRSIEVLTPIFKDGEKISDTCAKCHSPLYCEKCETYPTHKPYPKQVIKSMITDETKDDGSIFGRLNEVRNGLAHGDSLHTVVPDDEERIRLINTAGELALFLICKAMLKTSGDLHFTGSIASTYVKGTMGACASIRTVFPVDADGLPAPGGVTFNLIRSSAPADELPTLVQFRRQPGPQ